MYHSYHTKNCGSWICNVQINYRKILRSVEIASHVAFWHFHTVTFLQVSGKSSFSHPNELLQLGARVHQPFDQSEKIYCLRNVIEISQNFFSTCKMALMMWVGNLSKCKAIQDPLRYLLIPWKIIFLSNSWPHHSSSSFFM